LITSPVRTDNIREHSDAFSNELRATGAVTNVALTDIDITNTGTTNSGLFWKGKPADMQEQFWTLRVTPDFGAVSKWDLVAGRDFLPGDTSSFIINETAAKYMGMKSPVGEVIRWGNNGEFRIIGVVKDMITLSPYSPVKQMIFFVPKRVSWFQNANMRLNPEMNVVEAIDKVSAVFKKYDPDNAFEYSFVNQRYAEKFNNERRVARLCSGLAGLAIFICCLGLFGLASYMAERRTKEIGIRKVLGASIGNLWRMMSKDFVMLVVIAGVIAVPVAYYIANDWLSQFEYRVLLSWYIFVAAIAGALVIALLTVSYHALRSALANPVNSLRSE
jgi:putative ABC transport system permease protein